MCRIRSRWNRTWSSNTTPRTDTCPRWQLGGPPCTAGPFFIVERALSEKPNLESRFERGLFASRWLMAPMYLGLVVSLAMLLVIFLKELAYYAPQVFTMTADEGILAILTLIDLSLAASLVIMVMFSGYENFVSKLEIDDHRDRPDWMGQIDFSALKLKLLASIIAISAIHLLKAFMNVNKINHTTSKCNKKRNMVIMKSVIFMALTDRLSGDHHVPKVVPVKPGESAGH